jgi:hypothetical protein
MSDVALPSAMAPAARKGPNLDGGLGIMSGILFGGVIAAGLLFVASSIHADVVATGTPVTTYLPFLLLFVALLIALGFEFVNGFHDTANAVATVIYTRSLSAHIAVVWSGLFNLLGVLLSSGAVAFGIVSLLPVELILQVGSNAGFAMVFALLIAAIIWNVGTWCFGLPASSSHTLIGSIIGVASRTHCFAGAIRSRLVSGDQHRQGTTAVTRVRLRVGRCSTAAAEDRGSECGTLRGAARRPAATMVDSGHFDPHLHLGELLSRLQRRPEGHGPDHAYLDRHGAHRLRPQSDSAAEPHGAIHHDLGSRQQSDRSKSVRS